MKSVIFDASLKFHMRTRDATQTATPRGRTLAFLFDGLTAFAFFDVATPPLLRARYFVELLRLEVCLVVNGVGKRILAATDG